MGHPRTKAGQPGAESDSHLAPHFDTPSRQFTAGQQGMWLFIATELLMFGGLFCAYAIYRGNHPEIFAFGARYLDRTLGFLNTLVLILSSFTMALAVRAAQCNQRRQLVLFLSLTLICAVDFLAVKYVEYSHKLHEHLVWGRGFYQGAHAAAMTPPAPVELLPGDSSKGRDVFGASCAACHGREAEGMEKLGPSLRDNTFIGGLDDLGLVAFVKAGRPVEDPLNRTGVMMPPKGGNPLLKDQDLMDVVTHLRTLQKGSPPSGSGVEGGAEGEAVASGGPLLAGEAAEGSAAGKTSDAARTPAEPSLAMASAVKDEDAPFRSVIPRASAGPEGLAPQGAGGGLLRSASFVPQALAPVELPANAHIFFAIYFCMTGLHGIHVLVGIGLIAWLRARAVKGHFSASYYTPVELGGLYWHLVDIIWIFLFPLFYLI